MSKTIFKYPVVVGINTIKMPEGAQILTVQNQAGIMMLWAIVNTDKHMEQRVFTVFGTGHSLPDNANVMNWIATVQDGIYVWHIFELK